MQPYMVIAKTKLAYHHPLKLWAEQFFVMQGGEA
jgi:hypothetical protein